MKKTIFNFLKNKDESINRVLEVLNKVLRTSNYQQIIDKLNSQKEKTKRNLEALLDNLLDGTISKEVYKNKEKQLNEKLQSIEDEIKTLEEKNKGLMDKRERLLTIKNKLNTELETEDGITDEMVNNLIDKVYIYPDGIIKISLLNDQTVEVKREDKNLKNVSADKFQCYKKQPRQEAAFCSCVPAGLHLRGMRAIYSRHGDLWADRLLPVALSRFPAAHIRMEIMEIPFLLCMIRTGKIIAKVVSCHGNRYQ